MDLVPHTDLIRNETVRGLCGGISRNTLLAWRRERGFPQPLDVDGLELWDRRQVKDWIKGNRDAVSRARKVRKGRKSAG